MATVTSYTAEKMKQIEDSTIVDGFVASGNLILTRRDSSQINAGSVIGPQGIQGPTSPGIIVCTSSTRPTGGALFTGLAIYEIDTKRFYIYDGTTWLYRGGIWICTSSVRPVTPFAGLMIYETDTKRPYIYDGTIWIYIGGTIICTSSTHPTVALFKGLRIYETDTNLEYIYDGSAWTPPIVQVPHTTVVSVVAGGGATNSAAFVNFSNSVQITNFPKYLNATKLVATYQGSLYNDNGFGQFEVSVLIAGVEHPMVNDFYNYGAKAGSIEITGLAANAYTCLLRRRCPNGAGQIFDGLGGGTSRNSLMITETF